MVLLLILLIRGRGFAQVPEELAPEYRPIAAGIRQFELKGPGRAWSARGIEVDYQHPEVALRTVVSRPSPFGRETLHLIHQRWNPELWNPLVMAGCDYPGDLGMARGFSVEYAEFMGEANGTCSLLLTGRGQANLAVVETRLTLETPFGRTLPIARLNHLPREGETALVSRVFAYSMREEPGRAWVPLEVFDLPLAIPGRCVCYVGIPQREGDSVVVPRYGYLLGIPQDQWKEWSLHLHPDAEVELISDLFTPEIPAALLESLRTEGTGKVSEDQLLYAVSAGPRVLRKGQITGEGLREGIPRMDIVPSGRRSFLGIDGDRGLLWVCSVKADLAPAVSFTDGARCLFVLGARDGMALASDDRATIRVREKPLNPPLTSLFDVPVSSALVVCSRLADQVLDRVDVEPEGVPWILPRSSLPFTITGIGPYGFPVPLTPEMIRPELVKGGGRMDGMTYHAPGGEADVQIDFQLEGSIGSQHFRRRVTKHVGVRKPDRLLISPRPVIIDPGERVQFTAELVDKQGLPIRFDHDRVEWRLRGDFGEISPGGVMITSATGTGVVEARFEDWRDRTDVHVGKMRNLIIDRMLEPEAWTVSHPGRNRLEGVGTADALGTALLHYGFLTGGTPEVTVSRLRATGGEPYGFQLNLFGDGSRNRLRCLVSDANGRRFQIPISGRIDWKDEWRAVTAALLSAEPAPGEWDKARLVFPVRFEGFSLYRNQPMQQEVEWTLGIGPLEVLYLYD